MNNCTRFIKKLAVNKELNGSRLDKFIVNQLGWKRSVAYKRIKEKRVEITGSASSLQKKSEAHTRLVEGDVVVITIEQKPPKPPKQVEKPEFIQLLRNSIVYKDEKMLVLNKPAKIAVQGGNKSKHHIDMYLPHLQEPNDSLRLVHRLDRDTTGLLVVARNQPAASELSKMFAENRIEKTYWAVVNGCLSIKQDRIDTGLVQINAPPNQKMSVTLWNDHLAQDKSIKRAITDYKVLSISPTASLLELKPVTGRKHQLRAHLSQVLKAPIVGDLKYAPNINSRFVKFGLALTLRELKFENATISIPANSDFLKVLNHFQLDPSQFSSDKR